MKQKIPVGKLHKNKLGKSMSFGDRRFKIDPEEKDPFSPRFDWSRVPKVRGGAYLVPISSLPKTIREQILAERAHRFPAFWD